MTRPSSPAIWTRESPPTLTLMDSACTRRSPRACGSPSPPFAMVPLSLSPLLQARRSPWRMPRQPPCCQVPSSPWRHCSSSSCNQRKILIKSLYQAAWISEEDKMVTWMWSAGFGDKLDRKEYYGFMKV